MADWRDARCIETLRNQLNVLAPNRSKATDGTRASPEHTRQNPTSDHEPNAAGVVTAFDVTHDPAGGMDARALAETLRLERDSRIKYVISDGRIFSATVSPWEWRHYTGANAHRTHTHISVVSDPALYDDPRAWLIGAGAVQPKPASPLRQAMAQQIVDFEASRDAQGHIQVYNPPANDGGGAFEVAGINVRWHASKAEQLRALIEGKHYEEAEAVARDYVLAYTAPVTAIVGGAGLEFFLRDSYFNRGPGGAVRILQRALAVDDDGIVGPVTRAALAKQQPERLLTLLRGAREDYERNVVGYRENLWRGLVSRWDKALAAARRFQSEQPTEQAMESPVSDNQNLPQTPTPSSSSTSTTVTIDLEKAMEGVERMLATFDRISAMIALLRGQPVPTRPAAADAAAPPRAADPAAPVPAPSVPVLKQLGTQIGTLLGILTVALQLFGILPPGLGESATSIGQGISFLAGAAPVAGAQGIFGLVGQVLRRMVGGKS